MKRCLADVNVLLPLFVRYHKYHSASLRWFSALQPGEGALCRFVQLALIRLMGNGAVMTQGPISASAAWVLMEQLLEDERIGFATEPVSIDSALPAFLRYQVPTPKLVSDAYLAAFSVAASMRMVTFDNGFRQYSGVDLHLLQG